MVGIVVVVVEQAGWWKTKEFCFKYWVVVANIKREADFEASSDYDYCLSHIRDYDICI